MRSSVFIFCIFIFSTSSTEDCKFKSNDNELQHRTTTQYDQLKRDQEYAYAHTSDQYSNQYDYRHSSNDNQLRQPSYGHPAPPGFKQTESVFHILFIKKE